MRFRISNVAYVKNWQRMLSIAQNVKIFCASLTYLNYRSARTAIRYYYKSCTESFLNALLRSPYMVFKYSALKHFDLLLEIMCADTI